MEKGIADFYITLATSMAGLFIITGAFVIFQYQNISLQTTQTYDLLRRYLTKAHSLHYLKELIEGDKDLFKKYQEDKDKFDKSYDLWLEKDIRSRFKPMIILYGLKYEKELDSPDKKVSSILFAVCDYYLAITAQEKRKEDFGKEFRNLVCLNGGVFIASISMILFRVCFSFFFLKLLTLGFLFLTVFVVWRNIDCICKGLTDVNYDQINNWENEIDHFNEKYPQEMADEIINNVKEIRKNVLAH